MSMIKLTGHIHFKLRVPSLDGIAEMFGEEPDVDIDIRIVDRDDDGDPEIEVKWDLPGTAFDSGSEPKKLEVPMSKLFGPVGELVEHALDKTGAPSLLTKALSSVLSL